MTPRGPIAVVLFTIWAGAAGCTACATAVPPEERSRDFIHLDPSSPRLAYIKVEVTEEADVAPNVQLTGRVTFDEDHTQRVSSPIDGRVTKILVQPGDGVKDGQALVELVSAQAAAIEAEAQKGEQGLSVRVEAVERADNLRVEAASSAKQAAPGAADVTRTSEHGARAN